MTKSGDKAVGHVGPHEQVLYVQYVCDVAARAGGSY